MNELKEYYENYRVTSKYGLTIPNGSAQTIEELYQNCIKKYYAKKRACFGVAQNVDGLY